MTELEQVLYDVNREQRRVIRNLKKIIVLLIVLMFLLASIYYAGFIWYESQFEYSDTVTETTEVTTGGDNANAEYNSNTVEGNQYNGNTTYEEGGED